MFVVNTTSATAGAMARSSRPRKRVPSSRRRNPGRERWSVTGERYFLGCAPLGAGAGVAGGVAWAGVFGAASSGTAGFDFCVGATGAVGTFVRGLSSTEAGTLVRVEAI